MCDDHGAAQLSRRSFLGIGAAAATGLLPHRAAGLLPPRLALTSAARPQSAAGGLAYKMAMHIHSSFSEQSGSMDDQLYQAALNAVDVCWWTDHDHLMDQIGYRDVTHFTSFAEQGAPGQGGAWKWTVAESGPNTSASTGGIVQNPCSPNDPVAGGALSLTAKSSGTGLAKYGFFADCQPARWNYRGNVTGLSIAIDVLLPPGWANGYLELLVSSSYHQAAGSAPAGGYTLSYQFVPAGQAGQAANGVNGIITVPVTPGSWQTVTLTPAQDIAALWPAEDNRDFAMWGLTFSAASTGDLVQGYFDYMRFNRSVSGQAFFNQQAAMEAALAGKYPSVTQQQGLEVSLDLPHINWFGPGVALPDYGSTTSGTYSRFLQNTVIPQIHASGGLASYNHPYGYGDPAELPQSQQDTLLTQTAAKLLASKLLGADLLEVGYKLRQGVDLNHHLALWDVMSRNAIFLTGNGVSDDHFGTDWAGINNNWVTSAWAASTNVTDLVAALAAGRAWCGSLTKFTGQLDLLVDGSVPMGGVSVSSATSRQLAATAAGMPAGSTLQILQGDVDYAGAKGLASNVTVIGSYPASKITGGQVSQAVDTSQGSFVRTQVLAPATGAVLAASNPVWLLRTAPPGGIPAARQT